MSALLQIIDFSCGYKSGFCLENINLSIEKASFTGIIGPNGSGKTTLFKGISGILPKHKGQLLLNNKDMGHMGYKEKARHIAVVSQFIDPVAISVEEYVLMGRLPYQANFSFFESKEDIDIAHHYMQLTDIWHMKDMMLDSLSGGEQQMVAIARALTQQPELLLLDEPTAHLDITHQLNVMNLIQKLNNQLQLSVLMIIHDLNMAGEYCNNLILMNNGKIHCEGTPDEVLNYSNIEEVYKTVVISLKNPLSGRPVVFPVSQDVLNKRI